MLLLLVYTPLLALVLFLQHFVLSKLWKLQVAQDCNNWQVMAA